MLVLVIENLLSSVRVSSACLCFSECIDRDTEMDRISKAAFRSSTMAWD
jgi:hypothetical protein